MRAELSVGTGQVGNPREPGRTVPSRRLLIRPNRPALELLQAGPANGAGPPLLFVHGAFAGAWCWSERFLGVFGDRGRRAAAVSLRGHGRSEGRRMLRSASLDDLVDDVEDALVEMGEETVLVAHSLGGYLAQLLIGRARMAGLVLMGSLPPDGMALVGARIALTDPRGWSEALMASVGNSRPMADLQAFEILFGEGVPLADVRRHAARMVPESPRAFAEAHLPRPVTPALWSGLPTLVVNGGIDRLVWPATSLRTAWYHGADHHVVPEGGHFLMLDPSGEAVAAHILGWLERRGL